mgnify:CR=1 FL=1
MRKRYVQMQHCPTTPPWWRHDGAASDSKAPRIFVHTTFFFTKLAGEAGGYNFANVRRWTRKVRLFDDFDAVMVPINFKDYHWAICVITVKDRKLYYFDSSVSKRARRRRYVLANIERQRAHVAFLRDFIVKQESEFVAGDRWTLGV